MKEEIIKIEVPEGKKAVPTVDTNGNIVVKFEDAEPIRSRSWAEFCRNNPEVENEGCIFEGEIAGPIISPFSRRPVSLSDLFKQKEDAEGLLAFIQLTLLHDEWVGDWSPVYSDGKKKYFIARHRGNNSFMIDSCYEFPRFLVFPSKEMTHEFLRCFKDLLEKAKRFI